jgi:nitrogen fixation NifU-like protein
MTSDDLYQAALLAHAKDARHAAVIDPPASAATRDNPLCGDRATITLRVVDGRIAAIGHKVRGCVLCRAAAAVLAAEAIGRPVAVADDLRRRLRGVLAGEVTDGPFGDFTPVARVPGRWTCVTLPLDALDDALVLARTTA